MIDKELVDIFRQITQVEVDQSREKLRVDISRIEASRAGGFHSGYTILQVTGRIADQIALDLAGVWSRLHDTLTRTTVEIDNLNPEDIISLINEFIPSDIKHYQSVMEQHLGKQSSSSDIKSRVMGILNEKYAQELTKITGDVRLFVHSMRAQSVKNDKGNNVVINAHTIVSVQTGNNTTANTIQNINLSSDEIVQAIESLQNFLSQIPDWDGKSDLVNDIEALDHETQKDNPDMDKFNKVLTNIAQVIQTTANLGPAYGFVKTIGLAVGIPLP